MVEFMTLASYVFPLYCCTLCMLCILHFIQKHIEFVISNINCCGDRLLDRLNYFLAQKNILSDEIVGS